MSLNLKGRISPQEYCEILFNDLGFLPSARRAFLAARFGGRKYLDELRPREELSPLIDELKQRKEAQRDTARKRKYDDDESTQEAFPCV
jgi:hypothetical protein